MVRSVVVLVVLFAGGALRAQTAYHVAPTGRDADAGTEAAPWASVAYAASAASGVGPGDTVLVAAGVYPERVTVEVSGEAGRPVVFRAADGARPVLDGAGLTANYEGLVTIEGRRHVVVEGFEIRDYASTSNDVEAIGILVSGAAAGVTLRDNVVHGIAASTPDPARANAHGILVRGDADVPLTDVVIEGNVLYDLTLGTSEALVLTCNVDGFAVLGNEVRDVDNIGIDVIGMEGDCAYAARNGVVRGNRVLRASSCANPSYDGCEAGGIYVDGGRDVVVEQNRVEAADFGIEVASENTAGEPTRGIVVRNNVLVGNTVAGLAIGGYDRQRAGTAGCALVNNTLVGNGAGAEGIGGIYVQFHVTDTVVANNLVVSPAGVPVVYGETPASGAAFDHNLYHEADAAAPTWAWGASMYTSLPAWRAGTGNDGAGIAADPLLDADLRLGEGSPALDAGDADPCASPGCIGAEDVAGGPRVEGVRVDLGAYERPASGVTAEAGPETDVGLVLLAPAPNPARGLVRLALVLDAPQAVAVDLLDALGRQVQPLFSGRLGAGEYAAEVEVGALAPGTYAVRAVGERGRAVRPLVVVR